VYNSRCLHDNVVPNDIKIKTTVRGKKDECIVRKAEKDLIRERKHQCEFTIKKIKIEKDSLEKKFYDMFTPDTEMPGRVCSWLGAMFDRENDACKTRQRRKFEKLKDSKKEYTDDDRGRDLKTRWVINHSSI
jgi:hypothetical protein